MRTSSQQRAGPSGPPVEQPSRMRKKCCYSQRNLGSKCCSLFSLQLTSHTQPFHNYSNKVWEVYFSKEVCLFVIIVDFVSACMCIVVYVLRLCNIGIPSLGSSLPNYLPIAGERIIGFMPFPSVLVRNAVRLAQDWTRLAVSISYDDNITPWALPNVCVCMCDFILLVWVKPAPHGYSWVDLFSEVGVRRQSPTRIA